MPAGSIDISVDVQVLGSLTVRVGDETPSLGGYKQRSLLAYLLINSPEFVTPDQCIEAVWGENAPEAASKSLQTYVYNLRKILEPGHKKGDTWKVLDSSDRGYRLTEEMRTDVEEFKALLAEGTGELESGRIDEAANLLSKALDLWKGDPLGEIGGEHWAMAYSSRLGELKLEATSKLIDAQLAQGHHESLVSTLEGFVDTHPLNESFWGQLMIALYRSGRQADALRAFQRASQALGEELGIEPGPDLSRLEQQILEQDPTLDLPAGIPGNIPAPLTPMIGREHELDQVAELSEVSRLVTIMGPPGAGKTRLAIETALDVAHRFGDGAWLVELAAVTRRSQIQAEILGAIGVGNPPDMNFGQIVDTSLADKQALFVLDNCEHVVEDVSSLIATLLGRGEKIRVIATSRRALGIPGEVTLAIPGLSLSNTEGLSEASTMFVDRAMAVDPTFRVEGIEELVEQLVAKLDGLPLAIELAAARLRMLEIHDLVQRMEHRFETLGTAASPIMHHRSLRRLVEWSYDLLNKDQQKLYRWFGIFPGGWTLATAETMVKAAGLSEHLVLDLLDGLVSGSLLVVDRSALGTRYRMLETIREHALTELRHSGEEEPAREAQRSWAQEFAWSNRKKLIGADLNEGLAEGAVEADNLQSVVEWEIDNDPVSAVSLSTTLSQFWWMSGLTAVSSESSRSTCYMMLGSDLMEKSLQAADADLEPKSKARALTALGGMLSMRAGKTDRAVKELTEAIEICRRINDSKGEAWARYYRSQATGNTAPGGFIDMDDTDAASDLFAKIGDEYGMALTQLNRAVAPRLHGDWQQTLEELDNLDAMKGGRIGIVSAHSLEFRGLAHVDAGDLVVAGRNLYESLVMYRQRLGPATCLTHALQGVAFHQASTGDLYSAAEFLASAESLRERLSMVTPPHEDRSSWVRLDALSDTDHADAHKTGRAWTLDQALETAALRLGHDPEALKPARS